MMRLFLVLALFLGATFAQNQTQDACQTWKEKIGDLKITKAANQTGGYYFDRRGFLWEDVQEFCNKHGMSIPVFETAEEMEAVKAVRLDYNNYWVGANDIDRESGHYYWTDGREVNSTWRDDRKTYKRYKSTCLIMGGHGLFDASCWDSCPFFCEVNAEYRHCV